MSKKDLYKNVEFLQLSLNDSYKSLNEKLNKVDEVNINLDDLKKFLCHNYETMKNYIDESHNLTKNNLMEDHNLTNVIVNNIKHSVYEINNKHEELEKKIDEVNHKFDNIYDMFRSLNSRLDDLELSIFKVNNSNTLDNKFYYKQVINDNKNDKYKFYILLLILIHIICTNIFNIYNK